ncbi:uncharacterized protein MELLADRAFT_63028 [Melampsora larici-populina 98AG31]|uniref:Uncharacterized protein n=1 Tax=Melampsora larici-populina (strain 98AG31 / pathotype 3-4-7) TaxID=747676 RepID=F4RL09_MELLP|nr:uncharacterized protein MELLADRAFT_63028 [Melampsora larici-populina 98AG31]EGG06818.1 hypothetical protein MELLADRAFT_63028 [Melampsora larici-populina 98AG31]
MDLVDQMDYLPTLSRLDLERYFRRPLYQAILDKSGRLHQPMRFASADDVDPFRLITIGPLNSKFDYDRLHRLVDVLCIKHSLPVPAFVDMTGDENWGILVYHNFLRRKIYDISTASIAIRQFPFYPLLSIESQYGWYPYRSILRLESPFPSAVKDSMSDSESGSSVSYRVTSQEKDSVVGNYSDFNSDVSSQENDNGNLVSSQVKED